MKVTPDKITPAFLESMSELMLGAYIIQVVDKNKDPFSPESVLVTMVAPYFRDMTQEQQHDLCAEVLVNTISKHNISDAIDRIRGAHEQWLVLNPNATDKKKKEMEMANIELMSKLVDENLKATKPIFAGRNMREVMDDYNMEVRVTLLSGVSLLEGANL